MVRKKKSNQQGGKNTLPSKPAQNNLKKAAGPQNSNKNNNRHRGKRNRGNNGANPQILSVGISAKPKQQTAAVRPMVDLREVLEKRQWKSNSSPRTAESRRPPPAVSNWTNRMPPLLDLESSPPYRPPPRYDEYPPLPNRHYDPPPPPRDSSSAIEMAVFHGKYPRETLTDMEANIVLGEILQTVFSTTAGQGPQFSNSHIKRGILFLTCANSRTRNWLENRIKDLKPWYQACLQTCPSRQLIPVTRVVVWIPTDSLPISGDSRNLLQLFENQNEGLVTFGWEVKSMERVPSGVTLVLDIDSNSMDWLKNHNFSAFCGFKKAIFKLEERPESFNWEPLAPLW